MRMRAIAGVLALIAPIGAAGQTIVSSAGPDRVALTVYRDPNASGGGLNLGWLRGFAMVSETRHVSLPAGEVDLRFEGVTEGILPQSAIVTGLGDALVEKNRDAKLLSPGTLLDTMLGQRVHLRRTSRASGAITEQEAVIRASSDGVVIQTEQGIEALRCTGLAETLRPALVPETLSARPTLSTRLRLAHPVEAEVKLTYLSSNFDWRAHYVGTLAKDGQTLSLFAWLTLANGDSTALANADTQAIAGRLNREELPVARPEQRAISLNCWPAGTTSDIDEEVRDFGSHPPPPPPPPPPSAPMMESIVVTGSRMNAAKVKAEREDLGDLKLYRIPIPVTVAARSQKQVALLEQPRAEFVMVHRFKTFAGNEQDEPESISRVLVAQNKKEAGLGLPLPSGSFTLFSERSGQPFLLGEGRMTDRAEGEKVEVTLDPGPGVKVRQVQRIQAKDRHEAEILVTNDGSEPARIEVLFTVDDRLSKTNNRLSRRDGMPLWAVTIPANGSRILRYSWKDDS